MIFLLLVILPTCLSIFKTKIGGPVNTSGCCFGFNRFQVGILGLLVIYAQAELWDQKRSRDQMWLCRQVASSAMYGLLPSVLVGILS